MAYTRLLRLYYKNERAIPADIPNACRLARATSPAQKRAVESVLREFFVLQTDGWHQKRCDAELAAAAEKGAANRENGKRGGRPRKEKPAEMGSESYPTTSESRNPTETQSVYFGMPSETLATSQEPLANNQKKKTPSSADADSPGFLRFWQAWPKSERKVAKAECAKKWRKENLEGDTDAITAHVVAMKATKQWRDGYDPAPLTYLNQRRWLDAADGPGGDAPPWEAQIADFEAGVAH